MGNNILRRELIGQDIRVVDSANRALLNKCGRVVDETKNTIVIDEGTKKTKLLKQQIVIETRFKGKKIRINGKEITRKPEDRIKSR